MTFFRASTFLAAGPASERRRSKLSVLHCGGETDECCLVRVSDLAVGGKQRCNCFGMLELHLPWLELTIITPLIGALLICRLSDPEVARKRALIVTGLTLFLALGAWEDFSTLHTFEAHDHWDVISPVLGDDAVVIDELSAPLLPLAALLYFLMTLSTLRTKVRRFPFAWTLVSLTLVLAMLSCRSHWGVIGLLPAQAIPPAIELRSRGRSTRVFLIHMALFIGLLAGGWAMIDAEGPKAEHSIWAIGMLIAAVLVRSGCVPVHCWMTDLFENATLGTALLYVTPMAGAYTAVRLVLPVAPDWALQTIALLSLFTAVSRRQLRDLGVERWRADVGDHLRGVPNTRRWNRGGSARRGALRA